VLYCVVSSGRQQLNVSTVHTSDKLHIVSCW